MIALRKRHEAYNSRPIERQYHAYHKKQTNTNTINSNKASHMVSYFTNNDDSTMRYIKQREKRWKDNWKSMTTSLANLQNSELSRKRRTVCNSKTNDNTTTTSKYIIFY